MNRKPTTPRERRKISIRRKISGTASRPRMTVYRSNKHIYVQFVDDENGHTLASASSLSKEVSEQLNGSKTEVCRKIGELAAQKCLAANIQEVVFDRNGFLYTGRIAAVAEGARSAGLKF